jgi:hypothetical protein
LEYQPGEWRLTLGMLAHDAEQPGVWATAAGQGRGNNTLFLVDAGRGIPRQQKKVPNVRASINNEAISGGGKAR